MSLDKQQEQLETLKEIRTLMERSSRFISLSGFSGVFAGMAAIAGVAMAYIYLGLSPAEPGYYKLATDENGEPNTGFYTFMLADMLIVLAVALLAATLLSVRKAKQNGQPAWDATAKRLVINLAIPVVSGAIFCAALLYHGLLSLIAPATLVFYGLGLVNASKYTLNDVRYLGVLQIILGLIASLVVDYGLLFWGFGFGVLHIIYGISMYNKYDK